MKKICTLVFSLFVFSLYAQDYYPPNAWFFEKSVVPCPYDSTTDIEIFNDWQIYQTLNNQWDGIVDSSQCISLSDVSGETRLLLNQIDPTRALFIRSQVYEDPRLYQTDWLYQINNSGVKSLGLDLNLQDTCENGLCSGLILGIEIPDTLPNQSALRMHYDAFSTFEGSNVGQFNNSYCLPTEKFGYNNLKEYIFKFTFDETNLSNHYISNMDIYIEPSYAIEYLTEIESNFMSGDEWFYYLNDYFYYYGSVVGKYTADSYPSMDSISYIEATPGGNFSEQQTINVIIDDYSPLIFQPFTAIRGALVEGSDSLRHITNLVNNGADMCLSYFIELVFDDNTTYQHQAGTLDFHGKSSCMAFRSGAALVINDEAALVYGQGGKGVLNLQPGSTVNIGQNATLEIDTRLSLFGKPKPGDPVQVFMELNPGSTLSFGKNAYITNIYAQSPDSKLNIYMNGGVLNESNLDADSRRLIHKIYPETKPVFAENITVFPNPVYHFLTVKINAKEASECQLTWKDVNGKVLKSEKINVEKGYNFLEQPIAEFAAGIYFLEILSEEGRVVEKVLKQ